MTDRDGARLDSITRHKTTQLFIQRQQPFSYYRGTQMNRILSAVETVKGFKGTVSIRDVNKRETVTYVSPKSLRTFGEAIADAYYAK